MLVAGAVGAQPTTSLTVFVRPDPSPFTTDWERDPQSAYLNVLYTGAAPFDYRLEAFVRVNGREVGRVRSPLLSFAVGPASQVFGLMDVLEWQTVSSDQSVVNAALRSGQLPEGRLTLCARLVAAAGGAPLGPEQCVDREIRLPEPPQLLTPANGTRVQGTQPAFQWMPIRVSPSSTLQYRVRIVERQPEQAPQVAMQANPPVLDESVPVRSPLLLYPIDAPPLRDDREYVWQVDVVDAEGRTATRRGASSELYVFRAGDASTPLPSLDLPDRLEIAPGVAYLTGLRRATVSPVNNEFGVAVRGELVLELQAPVVARIPLRAEDLVLDRLRLPSVRLLAGRLTGPVPDDVARALGASALVRFTDLRLDPGTGLSVGAAVQLPGAAPIPMDGRIAVTPDGLDGSATLRRALPAIGDAAVRAQVQRITARFPDGGVEVAGIVALLEREVSCRLEMVPDNNAVRLRPSCPERLAFELAGGPSGASLLLRGLAGDLVLPATGPATYSLTASAAVRFGGTEACEAALAVRFADGAMRMMSDDPASCEDGVLGVTSRHGALRIRHERLEVRRVAWQAGAGFDFELALRMTPTYDRRWPVLTLRDVVATSAGLAVTGSDARASGAPLGLGPAGLWPLRLREWRLPDQRVTWADWSGASGPIAFAFTGTLGLPLGGAPGLPPACAAAALEITNGRVGHDTLTFGVEGDFASPCRVSLPGESPASLAVQGAAGRFVARFADEGDRADTVPRLRASFDLPSLLRCENGVTPTLTVREPFAVAGPPTAQWPLPVLRGTVSGVALPCPVAFGGVQLQSAAVEVRLSEREGRQGIDLALDAEAELRLADQPVRARGAVVVDAVAGRLRDGQLVFQGPLRLDMPREAPLLRFQLNSVALTAAGLQVDGRGLLLVGDVAPIGVTFAAVTLDPSQLRLTAGRVTFDAAIGLEATLEPTGQQGLSLRTVAAGAPMTLRNGVRLDLAAQAAITPDGLQVAGDADARLALDGNEYGELQVRFIEDFQLGLSPPAVRQGRAELLRRGSRVAWLDAQGFHANWQSVAQLIPARLPLPTEATAYLQVRDPQGNLLVDVETTDAGVRVFTPGTSTVSLVMPVLARGTVAPSLQAGFSFVVDPVSREVRSGSVRVSVPEASRELFDLTSRGIPFRVDEVAYERRSGGAMELLFRGRTRFAEATQGPTAGITLAVTDAGDMSGRFDLTGESVLPLDTGPRAPRFTLTRLYGAVQASLRGTGPVSFEVEADGRLDVPLATGSSWTASAGLRLSPTGVEVTRLTADAPEVAAELGGVRVALRRLRAPRIAWDAARRRFDWELQFDVAITPAQLPGLVLPELRDVVLSSNGLVLPETNVPNLTAASFTWNGFRVRPLAFRLARTEIDWSTGAARGTFGATFDLGLRFDDSAPLPPFLRGAELTVLGAGFRDGYVVGTIEARPVTGGSLLLGTAADGPSLRISRLAGALVTPMSRGRPDDPAKRPLVEVTADASLSLGSLGQCPGATATVTPLPSGSVRLLPTGVPTGVVENLVPQCPISLGALTLTPGPSRLGFNVAVPGVDGSGETVWLSGSMSARLPATASTAPLRASGNITVDVARGVVLDGAIALDAPFEVGLPSAQPVVTLTASAARLDRDGFTLSGSGGLVRGTTPIDAKVSLEDLRLSPRDFSVTAGRAVVQGDIAITGTFAAGGVRLALESGKAPLPTGTYVRLQAPEAMVLSSDGVSIEGTARASLRLLGESLEGLRLTFSEDFALSLSPFAVASGRADLFRDDKEVAYLTPAGIFPVNILAALPSVPDSIALPSFDVAYVRLKDAAGQLVLDAGLVADDRLLLSTRRNAPLQFVLPGLARAAGEAAPVVDAEVSLVVDARTMLPVSGSVSAASPAGAPPLLSLADRGVPVSLRRIAFSADPAGARVVVAGEAELPASLRNLPVRFEQLELTRAGLAGAVEVGVVDQRYVPGRSAIGEVAVDERNPESLRLALTGARLEFGATPGLQVSGRIASSLFAPPGSMAPNVLFVRGRIGTTGAALVVDPQSAPGGALALGPIAFSLEPVGGQPAAAFEADAARARLVLSGVLRFPGLGNALEVSAAGFAVGTDGVTMPQLTLRGPAGLDVLGTRLQFGDANGAGLALALERTPANAFELVVDGQARLTGSPAQGALVQCSAATGAPPQNVNVSLRLGGASGIRGRIDNAMPRCPIALGALTLVPGATTFGINEPVTAGGALVALWARGEMSSALDVLAGSATGRASGTLTMDLAQGRILDGALSFGASVALDLPRQNPVFRFTGVNARLDRTGIVVDGSGQLPLGAGLPPVSVQFENLTFDFASLGITDGRAVIGASVGLEARLMGSRLDWQVLDPAAPDPVGTTFARLALPAQLAIGREGLALAAQATARFGIAQETPAAVSVAFVDDFTLGLAPFGVQRGRAELRGPAGRRIAYLDRTGLHPDDILAALPPLPRRIGLPDEATAYLEVTDEQNRLRVASSIDGNHVRIRPVPGFGGVRLVIPALREGTGPAPAVDVDFNLLVNARTFAVMEGAIRVTAPDGRPPLVAAQAAGGALELRQLAFAAAAGGYRLTAGGRLRLPPSLQSLDLRVQDLAIGPQGLSGTVELGTFDRAYVAGRRVVATATVFEDASDTLALALTGGRFTIAGTQASLALSGLVRATLFATGSGAARVVPPLFFTGTVGPAGGALDVSTTAGTVQTIALGPALFDVQALGGQPALAASVGADGVAVRASGVLRVPSLAPSFRVEVAGLSIGSSGVSVGSVRVQRPEDAELEVLGTKLALKDTTGPTTAYPAIALERTAAGAWVLAVNGRITLRDDVYSGQFAACRNAPGRNQVVTVAMRVGTDGSFTGRFDDVLPQCPIAFGQLALTPGRVSIGVGVPLPADANVAASPSAWMRGAMTASFPGAQPGQTVTATGQVLLDLATPRLLDGGVALAQPARIGVPFANPAVQFTVTQAAIDRRGLVLGGQASLVTAAGAAVTATLENLTLSLATGQVTDGRARFTSRVALRASVAAGGLQWVAESPDAPAPAGSYARLVLPGAAGFDRHGFQLDGTATAALVVADRPVASATAAFADGFTLGLSPVAVTAGRVDFITSQRRVAWLDANGLHPDDVLALLPPLPDSIALPAWDVAYVRLKDADGNAVVSASAAGSNAYRLTTRAAGRGLQFVLPGLKASPTAAAPVVEASVEATFNSQTWALMSGSVVAEAPTGAPALLSLASQGIPVELRRVGVAAMGGAVAVTVGGRAQLPAAMRDLPVRFEQLELTRDGLRGRVEVGTYDAQYVSGRAVVASVPLLQGDDQLTLDLTGARLELGGAQRGVSLSGVVRTTLFAAPDVAGAPVARPIFYTGSVTAQGTTFALDPSQFAGRELPLGPATFRLQAVGNSPALALAADGDAVTLTASGELRVPALGPDFAIRLAGFRVGTRGVVAPQVSVAGTPPSLTLAGARVTLDPAAIGLERESGGAWAIRVGGQAQLLGDIASGALTSCPGSPATSQAVRLDLRLSTAGTIRGRLDDVVPRCPVMLGQVTLTPGTVSLGFNVPAVAGGAPVPVWMRGGLSLELSALSAEATGRATGQLTLDLSRGVVLDGRLDLGAQVALDLPRQSPLLRFRDVRASLDRAGLTFSGVGRVAMPAGLDPVTATFTDVVVPFAQPGIASGSIRVEGRAAVQVRLDAGTFAWELVRPDAALPTATFARVDLPGAITVDAAGVHFAGEAVARFSATGSGTPSDVSVRFTPDFAIGLTPVSVQAGRAELWARSSRVAYLDRTGLVPENVIALLDDVPDVLPLPDANTAYIRIRSDDAARAFLFDVTVSGSSIQLRTRPAQRVALVLPALRAAGGTVPTVQVAFDMTINAATRQVTQGGVSAQAADGAPALLSLASLGIPLEVRQLGFAAGPSGYRFTVGGRAELPPSLASLPLEIRDVEVGPQGPRGTVELGTYDASYIAGRAPVAAATIWNDDKDTLAITLTGARLTLAGAQSALGLSGRLHATPFADRAADPAAPVPPLFFTGTASRAGAQLTVALTSPTAPLLRAGPLEVALASVGGAPPLAFTANAQRAALVLSGEARVPSLSPTFALRVGGFSVATDGISVQTVQVASPTAAEFEAYGRKLSFKDTTAGGPEPTYPTVGLRRLPSGAWEIAVTGRITVRDDLAAGSLASCPASSGVRAQVVGVDLRVSTAGAFAGRFDNVVPRCPLSLGAVTVTPGTVSIGIGVPVPSGRSTDRTPAAWLDGTVSVDLPAASGTGSTRLTGSALLDLASPALLDGSIAINQAVRIGFPAANPVFTFDLTQGRIDRRGVVLSGQGTLANASGATVRATFTDLALSFERLAVTGGSARLENSVTLTATSGESGIGFKAEALGAPAPGGTYARLVLPSAVTFGAAGLGLSGTASASLVVNDDPFLQADAVFRDGFTLGWAPVAVTAGAVDFRASNRTVATLDAQGLHPQDVLVVAQNIIPDSIAIGGSFDVAYVRLKQGGTLLVSTSYDAPTQRLTIGTAAGTAGIPLVLPSLRPQPTQPVSSTNAARVVQVTGSLTTHLATGQLVSGQLGIKAAAGQAIPGLDQLGMPITIDSLGVESVGGQWTVGVSAAANLPAPLQNLNLRFDQLTLGPQGVSGTVSVGHIDNAFVATRPALTSASFQANGEEALGFELTGARLEFPAGTAPTIRLVGRLRSALFPGATGSTAPLFVAGTAGPAGASLTVQQTATGGQGLPIGPAFLNLTSITAAVVPGDFRVTLDGTLTVPAASNTFVVGVNGLVLSTASGINAPTMSLSAANGPQVTLFGMQFRLQDQTVTTNGLPQVYRAVAFRRVGQPRVTEVELAGTVTFLEQNNTSTFYGLTVRTDGTVGLAGANLLSRPLDIVTNQVRIKAANIANSALHMTVGVRLPAPLDSRGEQDASFTVNRDGTVQGSALVSVLAPQATWADATNDRRWAVGPTTLHVRALDVSLDLSAQFRTNSWARAAFDVYLGPPSEGTTATPAQRIRVGGLDASGRTTSGFKLGFDGTPLVDGVSASEFTFDFQVVKLTVKGVSAPAITPNLTLGANDTLVVFSGVLSVNLGSTVSGRLDFSDFAILKTGAVAIKPSGIRTGTFTIANVITATVTAPVWRTSTTPFKATINRASAPAQVSKNAPADVAEEIDVLSQLEFGAQVDILPGKAKGGGAAFSGRIDKFQLLGKADGGVVVNLRGARFEMRAAGLDVSGNFFLNTYATPGEFDLETSLSGTVAKLGSVRMFGVVEARTTQGQEPLRAGIFVAAGVAGGITLAGPAPVATLLEFGGGFFYKPRATWITQIQNLAQVPQTPAEGMAMLMGPSGTPTFALMLYAKLAAPPTPASAVTGQVLLTVTDAGLALNGRFVFLSQDRGLQADGTLTLGFRPVQFYGTLSIRGCFGEFESNVCDGLRPMTGPPPTAAQKEAIRKKTAVAIEGNVTAYVFADGRWAVVGSIDATVAGMITGSARFAVQPAGMYFNLKIKPLYTPISLLEVDTISIRAFWLRGENLLGAAGRVKVNLKPFGLLLAGIDMTGALLIQPVVKVYAAVEVFVGPVPIVLPERAAIGVWASISPTDGLRGGLGKDPQMEALLKRTESIADELEAARNATESELATVPSMEPLYSDSALAAAFNASIGRIREITRFASSSPLAGLPGTLMLFAYLCGPEELPGRPNPCGAVDGPFVGAGSYTTALDTTGEGLVRDSLRAAVIAMNDLRPQLEQARASARALTARLTPFVPAFSVPALDTTAVQGDTSDIVSSAPPAPPGGGKETGGEAAGLGAIDERLTAASLVSGPSMTAKADVVRSNVSAAGTSDAQGAAVAAGTQRRIVELEEILTSVRSTTRRAAPGALMVTAAAYAAVVTRIDRVLGQLGNHFARRRNEFAGEVNALDANRPLLRQSVAARTATLRNAEITTLIAQRGARLQEMTGAPPANRPTGATDAMYADQLGEDFWWGMFRAGYVAAGVSADSLLASLEVRRAQSFELARANAVRLAAALDRLNQVQADAAGALYDMYDRILRTDGGLTPAQVAGYTARKAALARELTVPTVTGFQATTAVDGYLVTTTYRWNAQHPDGIHEFQIRDNVAGPATGFMSLGAPFVPAAGSLEARQLGAGASDPGAVRTATLTTWRAARVNNPPPPRGTVTVAARGGAGYRGQQSSVVTLPSVRWDAPTRVPATTSVAGADVSPPVFDLAPRWEGGRRQATSPFVTWVRDPRDLILRWSARDQESGIRDNRLVVFRASGFVDKSLVSASSFTLVEPERSVGGRQWIALPSLDLQENAPPVHVTVNIENGSGIPVGAMSDGVALDARAPAWPANAALAIGTSLVNTVANQLLSSFTPTGVTAAPARVGDACLGFRPTMAPLPPTAPAAPVITFRVPAATDARSGVQRVAWRLDTLPVAAYDSTTWRAEPWTTLLTVDGPQPVAGDPGSWARTRRAYLRDWTLHVVALDAAGNVSPILASAPFRFVDPTTPLEPVYCADLLSSGTFVLTPLRAARDEETGLSGYRYGIWDLTAGQWARALPAGSAIDWPALTPGIGVTLPSVPRMDGHQYRVVLQAVNAAGVSSAFGGVGEMLWDGSPPPTPTIASARLPWLASCGVVASTSRCLSASFVAPNDPHTGVVEIEWRYSWNLLESVFNSSVPGASGTLVPGATTLSVSVPIGTGQGVPVLSVRSRNGAGAWSAWASLGITIEQQPSIPPLAVPPATVTGFGAPSATVTGLVTGSRPREIP